MAIARIDPEPVAAAEPQYHTADSVEKLQRRQALADKLYGFPRLSTDKDGNPSQHAIMVTHMHGIDPEPAPKGEQPKRFRLAAIPAAAFDGKHSERLTAAEKTEAQTEAAKAAPLPTDWREPDED